MQELVDYDFNSSYFIGVDVSYNQPNLSSNASWNEQATIYGGNETIGSAPFSIFVDNNNTLYATSWDFNQILMWPEGSMEPKKMNPNILIQSPGLFVSVTGDIYINNVYDDSDYYVLNTTNNNESSSIGKGVSHQGGRFIFNCKLYFQNNNDYRTQFNAHFVCNDNKKKRMR